MDTSFLSHSISISQQRQRGPKTNRAPMSSRLWTKDEDERLLRTKEKTVASIASQFPGRSIPSIRFRRTKLGLSRRKLIAWSRTEDDILCAHAGNLPWKQIANLIPGRSEAAVQCRAYYLKIPSRGSRPAPKKHNIPLLDAVRLRAWEDGIGLQALDRELKTGGYFWKNGVRKRNKRKDYVNIRHVKKAVEFFGGELVIDWKDE